MTEPSGQEASKSRARTLLQQGVSIDDVAVQSGLNRNTVLGLYSALVRVRKRANARSERSEAETEQETEIQAENEREIDLSEGAGSHTPSLNLTPSSLPGSIPLLEEDRAALRKLVPEKAHGPLEVIMDNAARRERQRFDNNGHGSEGRSNNGFGGETYFDGLARLVDRVSMQRQADRIVEKMFPSEKNDDLERKFERLESKIEKLGTKSSVPDVTKQIIDAVRLGLDMAPKGEGRDPAQYILAGNQMRSDIEKNVQSQYSVGVQKSRIDLELEAMQQGERLDYKKLEYDERRAEKKDAADNKKWEFAEKAVKFLGGEHAGAAIEAVGGSIADKIRGSPRVPMATIICPRCQGRFKTNPELAHAMCPNCGTMLDKPTQQQPAQEQPSQSEQSEPSTEPQQSTEEPNPESGLAKLIENTREER